MSSSNDIFVFVLVLLTSQLVLCTEYYVKLTNDGPVVLGANITFTAEIFDDTDNHPDETTFGFFWKDDAIPQHNAMFDQKSPISKWSVAYSGSFYSPGPYEVEVSVKKWVVLGWWSLTSGRSHFNVTRLLNGNMGLYQNKSLISSEYISTSFPVTHEINLSSADDNFLAQKATSILTYWFIDCVYYGSTSNMSFTNRYNVSDEVHSIEALVLASFDPIPPPTTLPPPTTSTSTTTSKPTTTPGPTTTSKPTSTSTTTPSAATPKSNSTDKPTTVKTHVAKRSASRGKTASQGQVKKKDSSLMYNTFNGTLQIPFSCLNQTIVPLDSNKTYGYFHRKIKVQDPVVNLTITGNNWLQHEDMLMLQVKCRGSPPYSYCIQFRQGMYNVTGNETCRNPLLSQSCEFPVVHYFSNVDIHTVIIIVSNNINKVVSPVTVRFYQVVTKAQLSVIVVPISFSIIAAILIVFGVAYYIQNRSRFTVEVADFNFGQQYTDLEYKTFGERLRESFNNALNWGGPRDTESPTPPWPAMDNNKYGTMT